MYEFTLFMYDPTWSGPLVAPHGHEEIPTLKSVFEIPHLREKAKFLDTQCLFLVFISIFHASYSFQIECPILLETSYLRGCMTVLWALNIPLGQTSVAALWMSPHPDKREGKMERVGLWVNISVFFLKKILILMPFRTKRRQGQSLRFAESIRQTEGNIEVKYLFC